MFIVLLNCINTPYHIVTMSTQRYATVMYGFPSTAHVLGEEAITTSQRKGQPITVEVNHSPPPQTIDILYYVNGSKEYLGSNLQQTVECTCPSQWHLHTNTPNH